MSRIKVGSKRQKYTVDEVRAAIFAEQKPSHWRQGQFVFNRASVLYGDNFVRSLGYDPYYNDTNIIPFIEALTKALNNKKYENIC